MLWIRSHIKFAVNSGQLSSMNALQVECQKTTWCRANGISDKQFFYWQRILRQEAYQQMESQSSSPASSALVLNDKKEQASHPAFVEIRPDAMPEEESTVFRPDVIIRSGNLVMEISNTASEELIQKIRGLFHV